TVAGAESGNVRELMGALNRLVAFQAVNDRSINAETAKQLLGIGTEAAPGDGGKTVGREAAPAGRTGGGDEFGEFLADVTVTVGKAVEAWRARVGEAVLRWEGEGYRTRRLEALLERDTPAAVDAVIAAFTQDVERLKELEAEVAELDPQAAGQSVFRDPERLREAEEVAAKVRDGAAPPPAPSAAFPLAAYAVGPSNEVAVSAARAVLKQPGKKYNPLVLVGKSGLGKTHLLNAIGLELARGKRAVVACLSTQAFVDELIAAIDGDRVDWWRARYRRAWTTWPTARRTRCAASWASCSASSARRPPRTVRSRRAWRARCSRARRRATADAPPASARPASSSRAWAASRAARRWCGTGA